MDRTRIKEWQNSVRVCLASNHIVSVSQYGSLRSGNGYGAVGEHMTNMQQEIEEIMMNNEGKLISFLLLVCMMAAGAFSTASADSAKNSAGCNEATKLIETTGLVMKHENDWHDVYVSKDWSLITFDTKKSTITLIAQCLAANDAVTVYDGYSGKKLASYGPWGGFQVE
jgi:hypothetical protein